jgi:hypothetical protein
VVGARCRDHADAVGVPAAMMLAPEETVSRGRPVRVLTYVWPGRPVGELNDGEAAALVR